MQFCVYSVKGELCEVNPDKASHSCVSALAGQPRPLQVSFLSLSLHQTFRQISMCASLFHPTPEGVFGNN